MNQPESKTDDDARQVADTILKQMGGPGRLKAMVGARNFVFGRADGSDEDAGSVFVRFQLGEGARNDIAMVRVIYDAGADLYNVECWKKPEPANFTNYEAMKQACRVTRHEGVYFDSLMDIFERDTGFYLTLSPRRARAG